MGTARDTLGPVRIVGKGSVSIATATTSAVNFGSPTDINLAAAGGTFKPGDRVLVIVTADTAGTTDPISFSVQDAPDSAGSIGTPAAAVVTGVGTGGTGGQSAALSVQLQPGRPWLRVNVTRTGATDTHKVRAIVLAVPHNV